MIWKCIKKGGELLSEDGKNIIKQKNKDKIKNRTDEQKEDKKNYMSDYYQSHIEETRQYAIDNAERIKMVRDKRYQENEGKLDKERKTARLNMKIKNEKLTKEDIYNRTPIKFCHGFCQKEIDSINFNMDVYTKDGLVNKCKIALKLKG